MFSFFCKVFLLIVVMCFGFVIWFIGCVLLVVVVFECILILIGIKCCMIFFRWDGWFELLVIFIIVVWILLFFLGMSFLIFVSF